MTPERLSAAAGASAMSPDSLPIPYTKQILWRPRVATLTPHTKQKQRPHMRITNKDYCAPSITLLQRLPATRIFTDIQQRLAHLPLETELVAKSISHPIRVHQLGRHMRCFVLRPSDK